MFKCDCCGLCCRHIDRSPINNHFDRGDGVCRYFNEQTNLCTIYETRPIICNVDKYYESYVSEKMTRAEFYKINYSSCEILKSEYGV